MDERDWTMRQIKQLAELLKRVLARVLKLRAEGDTEQAIREIGEAYRDLFGIDGRFVQLMTPEAVRTALGSAERSRLFAQLLLAEAGARHARGETELAKLLTERALALGAKAEP